MVPLSWIVDDYSITSYKLLKLQVLVTQGKSTEQSLNGNTKGLTQSRVLENEGT